MSLESLLSQPVSVPKRKKKRQLDLSPQDEASVLDSIIGGTSSGLQYAAETLDKPGRAVRGLLAGKPSELLNILPFSDSLGLTDPAKSVSGRDLLEKAGIAGPNQAGLDLGDVGGFLTEVATDPLSYLSFGTATALGKSAKASGTATKGLLPSIRAGERSLVSASLPFTNIAKDFTGPTAAAVTEGIGKAAKKPLDVGDSILGMAGYDQPLNKAADLAYRGARGLFDPSAGGKVTKEGQDLAGRIYDRKYPAEQDYTEASRAGAKVLDDAVPQFRQLLPQTPNGVPHRNLLERAVRFTTEAGVDDAVDAIFGPNHDHLKPLLSQAADSLKVARDNPADRIQALGGSLEKLTDIGHNPRGVDESKLPNGYSASPYSPKPGYSFKNAKHREKVLQNVETDIINRIAADPKTRGKGARAYIEQTYGKWLDPNYGAKAAFGNNPAKPGSLQSHVKAVAKWVKNKPVAEWFNRGLAEDQSHYLKGAHTAAANLDAAQEFILENVGARQPDSVSLYEFFRKTPGFDSAKSITKNRALGYVAKQLSVSAKDAAKMYLPREVADAVAGALKPMVRTDGWGRKVLGAIDTFTDMTKRGLTLPFPKFHARNLTGGQYINLASGLMKTPADLASYAKEFATVAAGNLDPVLAEEMRNLRVLGGDTLAGLTPDSAADLQRAGLGGTFAHGVPVGQTQAPQSMLGKAASAPFRAGDWLSRRVETLNRAPLYAYLRKRGYEPVQAAKEVAARQFDYSEMTPVEREALRRVFPFYQWLRKSSGLVLKTIAQRPGGAMAQTIRAGESGRKESGWLPDYLGEGAAIPDPFGHKDRFITKLGLPTDDVFSHVVFGPTPMKTVGRTLEKAIATENPLLTLPYTIASGREPYFGRELRELYDYPTGDDLTNAVIGKSPLSRAVSTVRTLTDERKGVGAKAASIFAPFSVTDPSGGIERQKQFAVNNALEDMLDEANTVRRYESYYVPADEVQNASPDELLLLQLKRTLDKRNKAAAQAKTPAAP